MCSLSWRHNMPDRFHFQNIFPPLHIILWVRNNILFLIFHNLYIHDLGDPKWRRTIDRPYRLPGRVTAPEADSLLAKKNGKLVSRIFMVAPCIDNIKFFICPTNARKLSTCWNILNYKSCSNMFLFT